MRRLLIRIDWKLGLLQRGEINCFAWINFCVCFCRTQIISLNSWKMIIKSSNVHAGIAHSLHFEHLKFCRRISRSQLFVNVCNIEVDCATETTTMIGQGWRTIYKLIRKDINSVLVFWNDIARMIEKRRIKLFVIDHDLLQITFTWLNFDSFLLWFDKLARRVTFSWLTIHTVVMLKSINFIQFSFSLFSTSKDIKELTRCFISSRRRSVVSKLICDWYARMWCATLLKMIWWHGAHTFVDILSFTSI